MPTPLDRTLVHHRYLPNNVGTHLQLSILGQIGVNEISSASKANHDRCGDRTHDPRVLNLTLSHDLCPYQTLSQIVFCNMATKIGLDGIVFDMSPNIG